MPLSKDDYLKCPKCEVPNTVEFWDRHTKQEIGASDTDNFTSSGADKSDHDEMQTYFHCPTCNEEVDGMNLKSN